MGILVFRTCQDFTVSCQKVISKSDIFIQFLFNIYYYNKFYHKSNELNIDIFLLVINLMARKNDNPKEVLKCNL